MNAFHILPSAVLLFAAFLTNCSINMLNMRVLYIYLDKFILFLVVH